MTRGIISFGSYLPRRRLDRAEIREFLGSGGGRGSRTVASYDEDTTTLGVAAARRALASADAAVEQLWFATAEPAWLEKTNATSVWAALRLPASVGAMDTGGAVRSGFGSLKAALSGGPTTLVVASGIRTGLPGGGDEAAGGDGAVAYVIGDHDDLVAEYLGGASITDEFIDRWRLPGDTRTRQWEERFGEVSYAPLARQAWADALANAGVSSADVGTVVVTGTHARAAGGFAKTLGEMTVADDLTATVGHTGAAHGGLVLAGAIETAQPGTVIVGVNLADGVDVVVVRRGAKEASGPTVAAQVGAGAPVSYARFLQWRQTLAVQPPNRPEPTRISASAAARREEWKYGFVGSKAPSGSVHLPPSRLSIDAADPVGAMAAAPMADAVGSIVTFTVDRLVYSQSPPVVFAILDFDGGGRMPIELTDCDADEVTIGARVGLSFRRLSSADGIHNYFWKGVLLHQ